MQCDVAVLGGGPGGYPAAIRAAQLGANVVLIEQGRIGGTCITVGCIPTKAWVATAHALKEAHETFAKIGVNVSGAELDFAQTQQHKEGDRVGPRERHHRRGQGQRDHGRVRPRRLQGRTHDRGRGPGGHHLRRRR